MLFRFRSVLEIVSLAGQCQTPRNREGPERAPPLSEPSRAVNRTAPGLANLKPWDSPSQTGVLWPRVMRVAILLPLVLVAACASTAATTYPSLAIRPGERVTGTANPVAPPAPPPATAQTGSRLSQLRAQARAADGRFAERKASATALSAAARGAAVGSEAWSIAQIALASLEAARSEAMIALADLDSLYVTAKIEAVPTQGSGDVDAIGGVRDEVIGLVGEEDATLAALRGRLR